MRFFLMIFIAVFSLSLNASWAACTSPDGAEGAMNYFPAPDKTYKYCNGTEWVAMGGGGSRKSVKLDGWPDAILCNNYVFPLSTFATNSYVRYAVMLSGSSFRYAHFNWDGTSNSSTWTDCALPISDIIADGRAFYFGG